MAIVGYLDEVTRDIVRGWAWDPTEPGRALELRVLLDGVLTCKIIANSFRYDLCLGNIGDGRHGFSLDLRPLRLPLDAVVLHVEEDGGGEAMRNSPVRLEAPLRLDGPARQSMVALLQSPGSDDAMRDRLQFLADQADWLSRHLADRQSDRHARAEARGRKWRWRAADGPEPPAPLPRALVIDSVLPARNRDAGSNAIISHAICLRRIGYEVTFVAADMRSSGGAGALLDAGISVVGQPWTATVEEVIQRHGEFDLVYLHRIDVAQRYLPLARHYLPKARLIYSVADLHHLRLSRQAKAEDRPELQPAIDAIRLQEMMAAASCHAVITHSSAEARVLRQAVPQAEIIVVPWEIVPEPTPADFAARSGVAFVGHYDHAPNLDAALWLVHEIMPRVWRDAPHITCLLAGSNLPDSLRTLPDPRIVAVGQVDTLAQVLDGVRLTVAPLAYGAGLKGKVADSLAAGVPCVCSPIAAEGFDLPAPLRALVAGDTEGLAASIVRLHEDGDAFEACRAAGLEHIRTSFNAGVIEGALRRAAGMPALMPVKDVLLSPFAPVR